MEFNEKVHVGATHEVHGAVTEENTAATVGSGSLAVYATPAMAALMERAAVDGRAVTLKVTAYDTREEIGAGTHTRFAVAVQKFMAKAEGKK